MKDPQKPDKHRKYDASFCAEALCLAEQSRSTQAAARAFNIDPKCICQWLKAAQTPLTAVRGHYPVRQLCQVLGVPASGLPRRGGQGFPVPSTLLWHALVTS